MSLQDDLPYKSNAELVAMKEDLANRKFRVELIGMAVTAAFGIAAIASMFMFPALAAEGGKGMLTLAMWGASGVTSLITLKEVKKLEMDEEFISSYMKAKNHWGEGYREEVAEKGYGFGRQPQHEQAPETPQFLKAEMERRAQGAGRSGGIGF